MSAAPPSDGPDQGFDPDGIGRTALSPDKVIKRGAPSASKGDHSIPCLRCGLTFLSRGHLVMSLGQLGRGRRALSKSETPVAVIISGLYPPRSLSITATRP